MKSMEPSSEDLRKLHAEVNQIVGHRLLLTTLAVTITGAFIGWLVPREVPQSPEPLGVFPFLASIAFNVVLFALFVLSHHLTIMLRVITTYLDVTGKSQWERDWRRYRDKFFYWGYSRPQALVFLVLGLLTSLFPLGLIVAYPFFTLDPAVWCAATLVIGGLYCVFVYGMGVRKWWVDEGCVRSRWEQLDD